MSTLAMTRYLLECDGCQTTMGTESGGLRSALEARAAAYSEGWRFPPQLRADGTLGVNASDVCPKCIDGWTPERRSTGSRVLKNSEAPQ